MGQITHPELNRAITPREVARLQSFSHKFYSSTGSNWNLQRQIGNAVPPLAKAIGLNT
nr:DNA cytosine methyltransferase [Mycoplasmopsis bovis]